MKKERLSQIAFNAWLAGFIDGEGSIVIYQSNGTSVPQLRLSLSNTHKPTIDEIKKRLMGKYRTNKRIGIHKWRRDFRLHWSNEKAQEIIKLILPYLITKKEQANLAIKINFHLKILGVRNQIPLSEKESRMNIMKEVRNLNNKEYEQ